MVKHFKRQVLRAKLALVHLHLKAQSGLEQSGWILQPFLGGCVQQLQ